MTQPDVAALVAAYRRGEPDSLTKLMPLIYADLRKLARSHLSRRRFQTVQTTILVHEAYLRLCKQQSLEVHDSKHLLYVFSRAMRQYLSAYAASAGARKLKPGIIHVDIDDVPVALDEVAPQLILMEQMLKALADVDEKLVAVFECRYFGGLSEEETAEALDLPLRSVQRYWMRAKLWVAQALNEDGHKA